jgi:hypothetical protein
MNTTKYGKLFDHKDTELIKSKPCAFVMIEVF